jgi:sugar/nucleoside kinase (ribokinase family)
MQLFVPAVLLSSVVDPTGAGDTFAGGFMGYVASQDILDRHAFARGLLAATSMASFAVEDFSVNALKGLTRAQIDARIKGLEAMVKI